LIPLSSHPTPLPPCLLHTNSLHPIKSVVFNFQTLFDRSSYSKFLYKYYLFCYDLFCQ
jgi:hypothetical protein